MSTDRGRTLLSAPVLSVHTVPQEIDTDCIFIFDRRTPQPAAIGPHMRSGGRDLKAALHPAADFGMDPAAFSSSLL